MKPNGAPGITKHSSSVEEAAPFGIFNLLNSMWSSTYRVTPSPAQLPLEFVSRDNCFPLILPILSGFYSAHYIYAPLKTKHSGSPILVWTFLVLIYNHLYMQSLSRCLWHVCFILQCFLLSEVLSCAPVFSSLVLSYPV